MDMSTVDPSFNRRARGWDCPQCPATADEPCVTPRGARAQHSHHQRVKRAKAATATAANDPSYDLRARRYACPFCGAGTNEPCRKPGGGDAAHSHLQRVAIAKDQDVHAYVVAQNATLSPHRAPGLAVACPACGAGIGMLCKTDHGKPRPADYCHEARLLRLAGLGSGPRVEMVGTTAHVYLPRGTEHIIIGTLES
jgi:hypothetical protein